MSEEEYLNNLEELNKEIIEINNCKEYSLGRKILYIIDNLKKLKFMNIINSYKTSILSKNLSKKIININYSNCNKKIVVYSCITGNYDDIYEPMYKSKNIDYVLFTNNKNIASSIWQIRNIPTNIKEKDNLLINRYIKMQPFEFFKNYDYSIYIDGNIRVISDIGKFVSTINKKTGLSFHRHCARNCIYEEAKVCIYTKKGNKKNIVNQMKNYKKEGFPQNFGMLEANVIVMDLKNDIAKNIFEEWWKEFKNSKSKRDQLSLPYVIWKQKIKISDIGNLGRNVNNNYYIQVKKHK